MHSDYYKHPFRLITEIFKGFGWAPGIIYWSELLRTICNPPKHGQLVTTPSF